MDSCFTGFMDFTLYPNTLYNVGMVNLKLIYASAER